MLYIPVDAFSMFNVNVIGLSIPLTIVFELYPGVMLNAETEPRHRSAIIKNNGNYFM